MCHVLKEASGAMEEPFHHIGYGTYAVVRAHTPLEPCA